MSRVGPVYPGHIPDIDVRCPECDQEKLAIIRTTMCDVRNTASFPWLYYGHRCHFLVTIQTSLAVFRTSLAVFQTSLAVFRTSLAVFRTSLAIFWTSLAVIRTSLAIFRTSEFSFWSYSGHRFTMSGIGPDFPGPIPDIVVQPEGKI